MQLCCFNISSIISRAVSSSIPGGNFSFDGSLSKTMLVSMVNLRFGVVFAGDTLILIVKIIKLGSAYFTNLEKL